MAARIWTRACALCATAAPAPCLQMPPLGTRERGLGKAERGSSARPGRGRRRVGPSVRARSGAGRGTALQPARKSARRTESSRPVHAAEWARSRRRSCAAEPRTSPAMPRTAAVAGAACSAPGRRGNGLRTECRPRLEGSESLVGAANAALGSRLNRSTFAMLDSIRLS